MPIVNTDLTRVRESITVLRQAGYRASADAFEGLIDGEGSLTLLEAGYLSRLRLELNIICNTLPGVR